MQVVSGIVSLRKLHQGPLFLALGNFDGVHLGHKKIISATVESAAEPGACSAVLIFNPHPLQVLAPERSPALLLTFEDRMGLLGEAGVDYIITHPFTPEFAQLKPDDFARRILKEELSVSGVVVGFNYSFGWRGQGKPADLVRLGAEHGFSVQVINPVEKSGAPVASSRIRALLSMGRVEEAGDMLGYSFCLRGTVVHGDGRGRQLGFPTANVLTSPDVISLGHGVYLTRVSFTAEEGQKEQFWALTNVGKRPTFCKGEPSVEVHLLDLKKNLYGRELNVRFLQKIREEKMFTGPEELTEQIKNDVVRARRLIARKYGSKNRVSNVANGFSL
ncbi:MAG: bifunctional riboflavin kinase/FAD synthetase [Dethiobacter sp.]|jgi:riboflavin kinase/FMN adenylyltransferase|nr:bifunctional riboflavin kinase/FAD synthetase [Dethiobacter sp.]